MSTNRIAVVCLIVYGVADAVGGGLSQNPVMVASPKNSQVRVDRVDGILSIGGDSVEQYRVGKHPPQKRARAGLKTLGENIDD
jgi:hypothetical protein